MKERKEKKEMKKEKKEERKETLLLTGRQTCKTSTKEKENFFFFFFFHYINRTQILEEQKADYMCNASICTLHRNRSVFFLPLVYHQLIQQIIKYAFSI